MNRNDQLLQRALELKPELKIWEIPPQRQVRFIPDQTAWQGYAAEHDGETGEILGRPFGNGEHFTLDFGESTVGHLKLTMRTAGRPADSPVRLKLIFAEVPLEIAEADKPFTGSLSRAWIQDEVVNIDDIPATVILPRRYSMRYLYLQVVATPDKLIFDEIAFRAESAEMELPPSPENAPPHLAKLDRIALRTLRNCLQSLFEDGPKRDRRLWLGDLYLQAKADRVSYRRFELAERSIAMLAAFTSEYGQVCSCVYEKPFASPGNFLLDYPLLFPALILEHAEATGDREFAERYFDLALQQLNYLRNIWSKTPFAPGECWCFIDWSEELNKIVPLAGHFLFGLRNAAALSGWLGRRQEQNSLTAEAEEWTTRIRREFLDPATGLFVSGPERQVSYASQIWMILGGAVPPEEAGALLRKLAATPGAIKPVTPFLHHHLLEAYAVAGDFESLFSHLESYWGKMADFGADTFWEVFDPADHRRSPYHDARLNSACHAWSCAPTWFIRRYWGK